MGLLSADLCAHRERLVKNASAPKTVPATTNIKQALLSSLELSLAAYAGFAPTLQKESSELDLRKLYGQHRQVEGMYRECVKVALRAEANALLDKFGGWAYLKGAPPEPGDLHPLPVPDER